MDKATRSLRRWENATCTSAALGLIYHWLVLPHLRAPEARAAGVGELIDLAVLALVFVLALACALHAARLAVTRVDNDEMGAAWRGLAVGVTCFALYYLATATG
jgi:hypothetical protein